ncbi:DUF6461 domain-containing protein [Sphaerisporangium fuscum]|uniref:DUF6461 domain-containing protein n=1 Tax=Sphaerisporangium fuscum TaxID=2835868 RepID=UPI001BDCDFF0|nr:DUF6461 domain-containing protein [Sphaerisporangium fuscum]
MTTDLLAPYRWLQAPDGSTQNPLGDIYCVSFFRGLAPAEVLRRFGPEGASGRQMTFQELNEEVFEFVQETAGGLGGGHVGVVRTGGWSVAVEPWGWCATLWETAPRLSRGCEMVAVGRHDYAEDSFVHAVGGTVVTGFMPNRPFDRHGSDADRLNEVMREVGLPTREPEDDATSDGRVEDGLARVFALAAGITGVPMTPDLLDGPFLVGPVDQALS